MVAAGPSGADDTALEVQARGPCGRAWGETGARRVLPRHAPAWRRQTGVHGQLGVEGPESLLLLHCSDVALALSNLGVSPPRAKTLLAGSIISSIFYVVLIILIGIHVSPLGVTLWSFRGEGWGCHPVKARPLLPGVRHAVAPGSLLPPSLINRMNSLSEVDTADGPRC